MSEQEFEILLMGYVDGELDDEQRTCVAFAAGTLAHLRRIKDRVPIAKLLSEVLRITAYDAILLGKYLGERKLANVHKIMEQARTMDRAGFFTLDDLANPNNAHDKRSHKRRHEH